MVPKINEKDAVVTFRSSQNKIKIGDIITFISKEIETGGTPITHRVIGIVETESGIKYRTKGDHNNVEDFALIAPNEVIGKVILRIPMIGYLRTFMTKPIGWLLVVVIPCLLVIGSDIMKLINNSSHRKEEQKALLKEQSGEKYLVLDSNNLNNNKEDNPNILQDKKNESFHTESFTTHIESLNLDDNDEGII